MLGGWHPTDGAIFNFGDIKSWKYFFKQLLLVVLPCYCSSCSLKKISIQPIGYIHKNTHKSVCTCYNHYTICVLYWYTQKCACAYFVTTLYATDTAVINVILIPRHKTSIKVNKSDKRLKGESEVQLIHCKIRMVNSAYKMCLETTFAKKMDAPRIACTRVNNRISNSQNDV